MVKRFTNVSEVPLALGVFFASDNYDYNSDPNTISATSLIKPVRQVILAARVPITDSAVNLADMVKNRVGAAIHDGIERAWVFNYANAMKALGYPDKVINRVKINPKKEDLTPDDIPIYMEQRLSKSLGKWTVTGKFDFVGQGVVQDYKSTSCFTYVNQLNNAKYSLQGSIYRWLDPEMITEDRMQIHYLFTDWSRAKAKQDPDYPQKAFHTQNFNLMSPQETENYIRSRLSILDKFWNAPEDQLPHCTDEDLWRSAPVYKYYKDPQKAKTGGRSTKNFDDLQSAQVRLAEDKYIGYIKEVPGNVQACLYCPAFNMCSQKDLLIERGELTLWENK